MKLLIIHFSPIKTRMGGIPTVIGKEAAGIV
jgi:hypothetical protein